MWSVLVVASVVPPCCRAKCAEGPRNRSKQLLYILTTSCSIATTRTRRRHPRRAVAVVVQGSAWEVAVSLVGFVIRTSSVPSPVAISDRRVVNRWDGI
uniref:Putative secreted peptide n=1 Tax=Anopheles braziliensis TaxID=58242 RepID=A0A2M3ZV93_9DIPT